MACPVHIMPWSRMKILSIVASCVIRRIVTYHYMVLVEVKITHMKLITKNKRKEEGDKDRFCGWLLSVASTKG